MEERRRTKRTELKARLMMKRLGSITAEEVSIEIIDVSKSGVGFLCKEPLTMGNIYESFLTLWTKEVVHAFLLICRVEMLEDGFSYGATFVGMSEQEASRIQIYQTLEDHMDDHR